MLSCLLSSASQYMRLGLAPATLKTYDFAWKSYASFCSSVCAPPLPVLIINVCAFICFCKDIKVLKPPYIRSLLAGIQFRARCVNPGFPSLFSNPSIKLLLKGIAKASPLSPDARSPITLLILHNLLAALRAGLFSPYSDALLDSVFLLAFYGFLRCGEFTTPSLKFVPGLHITSTDLLFHPDFYSLSLKQSKSKGPCTIVIARIGSPFCPFRSMLNYLNLRGKQLPSAPLFITPEGHPMSRRWFIRNLNVAIQHIGLNPKQFSGHSFRIGAATVAAAQGVPPSSLQQLGRWSSSAFTAYIRPDADAVLNAQRSLML